MAAVYTATVLSPTGRTITVSSDSQTKVDAKLAVMIGSLVSEKKSDDVATPGTLEGSSGAYDDAVLTILVGSDTTNIQLQNVSSSHKLTGTKTGQMDPTDTDLIAIATAYGGTIVSGRYTRG